MGLGMLGALVAVVAVAMFMVIFARVGRSGGGGGGGGGLGLRPGMPDETVFERVRGFMDGLAPDIGPGQSYVDTNDKNVEWRGSIQNHPVRIECYLLFDVKIDLKVPHSLSALQLWRARLPRRPRPESTKARRDVAVARNPLVAST